MIRKAKLMLRYVRACLLRGTGLLWLAKRRAAKRGVVVMTLHRVLDDVEFFRSSSLPGILLRRQTFQRFASWAAKNFEIVDLSKGVPDWDTPAQSARIAFTFDDGWLDNYELATPVLLQNRIPTVIFVCPALMGWPFPFWPERVSRLIACAPNAGRFESTESTIERLKQMTPELRDEYISRLESVAYPHGFADIVDEPLNRTMTSEQVQELHAQGIRIGSHTLTHPILTSVPVDTARIELTESRRQIEADLGASCAMFAYPNGNHDDTTVLAAAEAGYTLAFTTKRSLWTRQTDLLRVPRVNIFEGKLTGPSGRFSRAMAEYFLFWNLPS